MQKIFDTPSEYMWQFSEEWVGCNIGWTQGQSTMQEQFTVPGTPGGPALGYRTNNAVKVIDVDPANPNIQAGYTILWHYPYENWAQISPTTSLYNYNANPTCSPASAIMNSGLNLTASYGGPYDAVLVQSGVLASGAAATLLAPPWSWLAAAAGISLSTYAPKQYGPAPVDFDANWNASTSVFVPDKEPAKEPQYRMTANLAVGYDLKLMKGQKYGSDGYEGPDSEALEVINGNAMVVATFTLGGGGGPG